MAHRQITSCKWQSVLDSFQPGDFSYSACCEVLETFLSDNGLCGLSGTDAARKLSNVRANETALENTELTCSNVKQILLDLDRTFPEHPHFIGVPDSKGKLLRVLCGYAMYNPTVGYCQGMGFIAAVVLMYNEDEERAFWITTSLFEADCYLSGMYSKDLQRIQKYSLVFDEVLKEKMPKIQKHLSSQDVKPDYYLTRWFMCMYTTLPCWDTVLLIWSHFLDDGFPVLFQAALACMDLMKDDLLSMDTVEFLIPFIQSPPADRLTQQNFIDSFEKFPLSSQKVEEYFFQTSALNIANIALPSSRKRGFEDTDGGHGKDSVAEVDPSFFQRFVKTFTPAKRKKVPGQTPAQTPASALEVTPLLASVKRKQIASAKRLQGGKKEDSSGGSNTSPVLRRKRSSEEANGEGHDHGKKEVEGKESEEKSPAKEKGRHKNQTPPSRPALSSVKTSTSSKKQRGKSPLASAKIQCGNRPPFL